MDLKERKPEINLGLDKIQKFRIVEFSHTVINVLWGFAKAAVFVPLAPTVFQLSRRDQ